MAPKIEICAASAVAPGQPHDQAVRTAAATPDPYWGPLSMAHVQLCPQHPTALEEELVERCKQASPATRFRLHASVRVSDVGTHLIWDASNAHDPRAQGYWRRIGELSRACGAQVYSLHAGRARNGPLEQAFANVQELQQRLGMTVAIEGLYPDPRTEWLLSDWEQYARLLESGLPFALDLSHLNIVAHRSGKMENALISELLSSNQCVEVHVSGNSGDEDSHRVINKDPWWLALLARFNPGAVVFSEATLTKPKVVKEYTA